jgi:hypothetical protein
MQTTDPQDFTSAMSSYVLLSLILLLITAIAVRIFYTSPNISSRRLLVATDPESSLAFGHPLPIDLPPQDLLEEIRGIPTNVVDAALTAAQEYCDKRAGTRPEWRWDDIRGVGEKRRQILMRLVSPPSCIRSSYAEFPDSK